MINYLKLHDLINWVNTMRKNYMVSLLSLENNISNALDKLITLGIITSEKYIQKDKMTHPWPPSLAVSI